MEWDTADRAQDYLTLLDPAEHPLWRQARLNAIAAVHRREMNVLDEVPIPDMREVARAANRECFRIATHPQWLPPRPGRRMPSAKRIAGYWYDHPGTFDVDPVTPECFRFRLGVESWGRLERAHLVDRWCGGLDLEPNLAMLCVLCHRIMPMFLIDQVAEAISWIRSADDADLTVGATG